MTVFGLSQQTKRPEMLHLTEKTRDIVREEDSFGGRHLVGACLLPAQKRHEESDI